MVTPKDVRDFWLEAGPQSWYAVDESFDEDIRTRFRDTWQAAKDGKLGQEWTIGPEETLAYLILVDQLPRNMFRGEGRAFSTDRLARAIAKKAIDKKWDLRVAEPQRQFFYLPLMHSECLIDQERCVRLMLTRMLETGEGNLLHAKAHREVIRRFGRFPYRNDALSRSTSPNEAEFIAAGGYSAAIEAVA